MRLSAAAVLTLITAGLFQAAPSRSASRSTAFADMDPGPRTMAMGGAGVSMTADPTAVFWNPAGLYFMQGTQATATYDDLYGLGLVQRNYLAFAVKSVFEEPVFKDNRMYLRQDRKHGAAWGLALSSVLVDLGTESYSEFSPSLAVAGGLGDQFSVGASLSYLRVGSDLEDVSAGGYTSGIGMIWEAPGAIRAGLSVRNLVSRVFWKGDLTERLRTTSTLGAGIPVTQNGSVRGDLTWTEGSGGPSRVSLGGEYWALPDRLAGRLGLRRIGGGVESRTIPSFGAGFRWTVLDVDYAYTVDEDGPGSTHRFGLNIRLCR